MVIKLLPSSKSSCLRILVSLLGLDLSDIDASINNGKPLDAAYLDDLSWETLFGNLCPAIKAYNDVLPIEEKIKY